MNNEDDDFYDESMDDKLFSKPTKEWLENIKAESQQLTVAEYSNMKPNVNKLSSFPNSNINEEDDFYDDSLNDMLFGSGEASSQELKECKVKYTCSSQPTSSQMPSDEPSERSLQLLKKYFGHSKFRPYQWSIINNALLKVDQLVVMSTGYGKSVCYQLPSLIQKNLTLVISPLISLMEDQVANLMNIGVNATHLGGAMNFDNILACIRRKELRLVYTTPEMYTTRPEFFDQIRQYVGLIAVDEAHCISQWGHEFRASYRAVGEIRKSFPGVPFMALTATATSPVRNDIINNLGLVSPQISLTGFDRANLFIEVAKKTQALNTELAFRQDFLTMLEEDPRLGPHFGGSTIIYCQTRKKVEEVTNYLRSQGVRCVSYHAGLKSDDRSKAHTDFLNDKVTTVCATVAFGMGIDKRDVRKVFHYGAPANIEGYYQEIGRAGRDGFPSKCKIFFSDGDFAMARNRIFANKFSKDYEFHSLEMLRRMEQFATTSGCRRYLLLSYFDSTIKYPEQPSAECCDNCLKQIKKNNGVNLGFDSVKQIDFGKEARNLFRVMDHVFHNKTGVGKPISFLRGSKAVESGKTMNNPQKVELFGIGKGHSETWWKELCKLLRNNGYLNETKASFSDFAITQLSPKALGWYESNAKELLLEPSDFFVEAITESNEVNEIRKKKLKKVSNPTSTSNRRVVVGATGLMDEVTEKILKKEKKRIYRPCSFYPSLMAEAVEEDLDAHEKLPLLRKEVIDWRYELSTEMDCAANSIFSNTVIEGIVNFRPTKDSTLEHVEGLPENRRLQLAQRIFDLVKKFCKIHAIPTDCVQEKARFPKEFESLRQELTNSVEGAYTVHVLYALSADEVAKRRNLATSTVYNYLAKAVQIGLPVHLPILNVDEDVIFQVYSAVEKNNRDIFRIKSIMNILEADNSGQITIKFEQLGLAMAVLKYEYGIEEEMFGNENEGKNDKEEGSLTGAGVKRKISSWIQNAASDQKSTTPFDYKLQRLTGVKKSRQTFIK